MKLMKKILITALILALLVPTTTTNSKNQHSNVTPLSEEGSNGYESSDINIIAPNSISQPKAA